MAGTIVDFFKKHINSDRFFFEVESRKERSFASVYNNALKRGNDLLRHDQKIISVILPNSICYIEYFLATVMTNNIFNPLPYFVSVQELQKIFDYVDPACIITDRKDIRERFGKEYCILDFVRDDVDGDPIAKKNIDINMAAALYYSSGTTGNPKGVLYSHKNMVSLIASIIRGFRFSAEDRHLTFLPFGHTAAINYNILPSLMAGSNLYISLGFEQLRADFFDILAQHKITYTEFVPAVILTLLKLNIDISKCDLRSLKFIGCGSSTLPLVAQKEFIKKYGINVANLYGLSETGPSHIDYPLEKGWEPGSIGVPLDVNKCKIAEDGEILLKGNNVFMGYHKNKKLYNEVLRDGWFYTGDLGFERDGKFYFLDRKKDLIIKGGINIVPMEVEEIFYQHAGVHECVVVGKEDKIIGEDVVAVVVPKKKEDKNADFVRELKQFCKDRLSNYKVPSKILLWDKLPCTHSNKLLRRKVRDVINASMEMDFLVEAVCRAGETAHKAFEARRYSFLADFNHDKIREKSQKELVIEEDFLCQGIIVDAIKKQDSKAVIYSEEMNNLDALKTDRSDVKYLIDPLDGTHNFCFGLPFWGISVAVLNKENMPIAAVIFIPEFDILLKCDGMDHPTMIFANGVWAQTTTAQKHIEEALLCYDNQFHKLGPKAFKIYERLAEKCFTTRITGSAVFDIALIASGKINGRIWNKTNCYDIAGGIAVVRGAGGSVSNFSGKDVSIFSEEIIMCSEKTLNKNIVELIGEVIYG